MFCLLLGSNDIKLKLVILIYFTFRLKLKVLGVSEQPDGKESPAETNAGTPFSLILNPDAPEEGNAVQIKGHC